MSLDRRIDSRMEQLWPAIQTYSRAMREGFWLEAIAIGYQVLDAYLRWWIWRNSDLTDEEHLLIEESRNLLKVAKRAETAGLITCKEFENIEKFNEGRRLAMHYFVDTDWSYEDLKKVADQFFPIFKMIQDKWMTITPGRPETP